MANGELFFSDEILETLGSIFLGAYGVVLMLFAMAWHRNLSRSSSLECFQQAFISVVVPFRNEAAFLPALMKSLGQQDMDTERFEVVAVNDHSEDGSMEWLTSQKEYVGALRLVNAKGRGKKNALKEGILRAQGNWIVTVDADCIPHREWLKAIMDGIQQTDADMLIGPVKMRPSNSFLSRFESIDYFALQMSGAAAAMLGLPVFCSGANLAFKKAVWVRAVKISTGTNVASGDDVFLLHAFKILHKKILFLKSREAMVETFTSGSVAAFFRQRARWGGKSTSYRDGASIALAIIVFLANLWLLLLLGFWMIGGASGWLFGLSFLLKAGADFLLLRQGRRFYDVSYSLPKHLIYSVVYPFVLVATAIAGLVLSERWK